MGEKISLHDAQKGSIWEFFTWPNQDDQMNMTKIGVHDRKIDNNEHKLLNMIMNFIFGQIHPYFGQVQKLMFVGVNFGSSSNIKVCRWEFFFGHILTNFWSY